MTKASVIDTGRGAWRVDYLDDFGIIDLRVLLDLFDSGSDPAIEVPFSHGRLWVIHRGGRATVYGAELQGRRYCIKVFNDGRFQTRCRTFLGFSKARRIFCNGLAARERNFPVPEIFAYAERRPFGPSLAVMRLLDNAIQLNLLIENLLAEGVDLTTDPFFVEVVDSFAKLARNMRDRGVGHVDFSPRNVLVVKGDAGATIHLIDLEDVVFSNDPRFFADNVVHFEEKLARYVNADVLSWFSARFNVVYGSGVGR
jgi:tRNA A-37 threonylcarbamoyl transferase component Bud32